MSKEYTARPINTIRVFSIFNFQFSTFNVFQSPSDAFQGPSQCHDHGPWPSLLTVIDLKELPRLCYSPRMKAAPTHPRKPHRSPNRNHAKAAPHSGSNVEITAASVAETSRIAMSYTHHIRFGLSGADLLRWPSVILNTICTVLTLKDPGSVFIQDRDDLYKLQTIIEMILLGLCNDSIFSTMYGKEILKIKSCV